MVHTHKQQQSRREDRAVLAICLLGQFQAIKHDESTVHHAQARLYELIALVLLHRRRPLSRQQLAATLWPESTDEQSRTNRVICSIGCAGPFPTSRST